jgi:hypothetical protein
VIESPISNLQLPITDEEKTFVKNCRSALLCLLPLALAALACAVPALEPTPTEDIGTQVALVLTQTSVAATQTALAQPSATVPVATATDTATPAPQTATIMGGLCYPSEGIPPLTVYAQEVSTLQTVSINTAENQSEYSLEVPAPGTYVLFAYTGFGVGGAYTPAVACGLTVDCTDHAPIAVTVEPGATFAGADICDYYGPPGSVPPNPNPAAGTIMGGLCYPSEGIPPLTVYAREVNTNQTYTIQTAQNQGEYSIQVPAPGTYILFAYTDFGGGGSYSQAVPCGLTVACTDHSLIQLDVQAGATVTEANICDWYGPEGSVPPP